MSAGPGISRAGPGDQILDAIGADLLTRAQTLVVTERQKLVDIYLGVGRALRHFHRDSLRKRAREARGRREPPPRRARLHRSLVAGHWASLEQSPAIPKGCQPGGRAYRVIFCRGSPRPTGVLIPREVPMTSILAIAEGVAGIAIPASSALSLYVHGQ